MSRSKKKTQGPKAPDAARVAAAGLDPADPKAALARLAERWGDDPDLDAWVVSRAGHLDDREVGEILHGLEAKTTAKNVRREIKRALYRLEQRGHWSAPDQPAPPSARELLGSDESDAPAGWLSPINPTGTRLVWMARKVPGGMASLSAVVSEDHGIREFHSGKTNRGALREAHKEIAQRSGIPLTEAPWPWVHHILQDALTRTERARFPDVPRVLKSIAPDAPEDPPAAVDGVLDRAEVAGDADALAASAELLGEAEIGTWLLPLPWMEETLAKLADTESSLVVVSPTAQEERMREALEDGVRVLLDDEDRRRRFANRLEESAFLIARRDDVAHARSALAAAIAARDGTPITEIPVLAEITRRSLALALQMRSKEKKDEEESSLVVTPQQAMAEQQRARTRRGG